MPLDNPPWEVDGFVCHGCSEKERLQKFLDDQPEEAKQRGMYVILVPSGQSTFES